MKFGGSVGPEIEDVTEIPAVFDFVEIAIGEMEVSIEEIDTNSLREDLEENDLGLIIHLPFRQPLATTVPELNNGLYNYYDRLLEFSAELGAEKAVVHLNTRHGQNREEVLEDLKDQIKELKVLEEKHGVELVYENIPFGASNAMDLEDLPEFAEELDISLCIDTGHAYAEDEQEGINMILEEAIENISHLHIQDSMGGSDSHVAVGHGDIDWEETCERLEEFEGTATLEIFTNDFEYSEISHRKLLEYLPS
ncbi:sugar phosphate isomerase/epimerase family protein [Candidatus Nanohalococcus occultus]|uniref:sugar phosphate isomerase/epimerase family protein n=1 Tax=Candidatus Nanohalococcus occultus TaxID=2978047 RepID=UPI0039DFFC8D